MSCDEIEVVVSEDSESKIYYTEKRLFNHNSPESLEAYRNYQKMVFLAQLNNYTIVCRQKTR